MRDDKLEFGLNAGKVWKALNSNGSLTINQLMNHTQLNKDNLFSAIGWLAKENKIKKEGEFFRLDETNMKSKIEKDAENIWSVIGDNNLNFQNLPKLTQLDESDVFIALGWLAREDKLNCFDRNAMKDENSGTDLDMNDIKDEINALNDDILNRNFIIKNITEQLMEKQTQFIENSESFSKLKGKFDDNKNILVSKTGELSSTKLEILKLKDEVISLNSELSVRNQIIKEISNQLSEKQTKIIETSGTIEQLRDVIDHNKSKMKLMSDKLNERINKVNDFQSEIENEANLNDLSPELSTTKLFNKDESLINSKNEIEEFNVNTDCNNDIRSSLDDEKSKEISEKSQKNRKITLDEI